MSRSPSAALVIECEAKTPCQPYAKSAFAIGILKRGSGGVCELWSVAEPRQNEKRKARPAKTEGGKRCVIARG